MRVYTISLSVRVDGGAESDEDFESALRDLQSQLQNNGLELLNDNGTILIATDATWSTYESEEY